MSYKLIEVKGIGHKLLEKLNQENIWSIEDLLFRYPKKYEDFTIVKLDQSFDQQTITIIGTVKSKPIINITSSVSPLKFKIQSNEQTIEVIAFNRAYLKHQIHVSDTIVNTNIWIKS